MKTFAIALTSFVLIVLTIVGCKGEDGALGPTGPSGNANVKSFQFTVSPSQWTDGGAGVIYFDQHSTLISQTIFDRGTLQVYYLVSYGVWATIPNGFVDAGGKQYSVNYAYGLGLVEVIMGSSNLTNTQLRTTATFKVVIIEGTASLPKSDGLSNQ